MLIRTTANIDKSIDERICEAAKFCGIKPRQIINVLMMIMIEEKPLEFRSFCAVEYQERRDEDRWKCFHLELTGAVYEASIDLRKLMKLSVSYLLSYAVEVYMDRAVEEIMRGDAADNYPKTTQSSSTTPPKNQHLPYSIHLPKKKTSPATLPTGTNTDLAPVS